VRSLLSRTLPELDGEEEQEEEEGEGKEEEGEEEEFAGEEAERFAATAGEKALFCMRGFLPALGGGVRAGKRLRTIQSFFTIAGSGCVWVCMYVIHVLTVCTS
jgi:hypothetical protein